MNWTASDDTALITVDYTNDFLPPHGALKVEGALEDLPVINDLILHFKHKVFTKEIHPVGHQFFASSHPGKKPLDTVETEFGTQYLWPDHCVEGTPGCEFHISLDVAPEDMVVVKGTDPTIHAYSAVYMDDRKTIIRYEDGKTLPEKLREKNIKKCVVEGEAYDFCAGMTAYDLAMEGFEVYFVRNASHAINIPVGNGRTTVDIMDDMLKKAGVIVVNAEDLPRALGAQPALENGPA